MGEPGGRGRAARGGRGGRRLRVLVGIAGAVGAMAMVGALGVPRPAGVTGPAPAPARSSWTGPEPLAEVPDRLDGAPAATWPGDSAPGETAASSLGSSESPGPGETAFDPEDQAGSLDIPDQGADWWSVLGALDARRLRALTERDPAALAEYLVPGSPAWDADSSLIAELRSQGLRPVGLASHVVAIEAVEVTPVQVGASGLSSPEGSASDRATVVLVDQRSAYTLVDAEGREVHTVGSPGSQRWEVTLERAGDVPAGVLESDSGEPQPAEGGDVGWRIAEVTPVG